MEALLTSQRSFIAPPKELGERWITDSKQRPTEESAYSYIIYKAAEWGFNAAIEPDPNSLKSKAIKALGRIQAIDVVSVWIGKDAFLTIREALEKLPNH